MRELKIPGQVRQLIKKWRETAETKGKATALMHMRWVAYQTCADQLEAALNRPVQRAKIKAKRSKRK